MLCKFLSYFFGIVKDNCLLTYLGSSRLEEVDQQSSINNSFLSVPQLVKVNNFFGQYLQGDCFEKILYFYYILIRPLIRKNNKVFLPPQ